jgi:cell cycle sensor histidine kinase DivJ
VGAARAEVQAALARTSYFGAETTVSFRVRGDGAETTWIEMHCCPLFPQGGEAAKADAAFEIGAALRDVSEQKQTEAALRAERDEALAAARAKSQFLANMSHELRTPLNAIIGFSEMMTAEMFGPLGNPRYKEYATHVKESGEHLRDLINDVLDVSKMEAGRYHLELERVSVPTVLDEALKTISVSAGKRKIKLDVQFPEGLPRVTADRRAVKQMLLNLLANAVKFTPEGGTVATAARVEEADMVIEVRDTGIGIPKAALKRLAQPYEQVVRRRRAEAPDEQGTGLGLALVKAFAAAHGGTLRVESEEGEGTCVRVRLPLQGPARGEAGPAQTPAAPVKLASRRRVA